MLESIGSALTAVIGWVGTVVTSFVGETGELKALLPLLAVGVGISALKLGIGALKSMIWGA